MADLSQNHAEQPVKIMGNNEEHAAGVSANNDLFVSDIVRTGALNGTVAVGTTAVEAKVGSTALSHRKGIVLEPRGNNVKWGFSSSTCNFVLFKDERVIFEFGPGVSVFLKADSGSVNVEVGEFA